MSDTKKPLIEISNLHVSVEETEILKGLNLTINSGEVHAIMAVSYTHLTLPTTPYV